MATGEPTNEQIADMLERIAELLEAQDANPYRIRAYRSGAATVRDVEQPVAEIVGGGDGEALQELPGIGEGLAAAIVEFVETGRSSVLERLQGEVTPEELFSRVPGIGEELAYRIATQLDIHTLEELEQAAHDGRLDTVEGFGPKRVRTVRTSLAGILSRAARRRSERRASGGEAEVEREEPPVDVLLDVDAEYRRRVAAGDLVKIAPRRFNPEREAWLPIMHTERGGWTFTVLYSNTARAHELGKTRDWVVIYYEHDGYEDQATVVTQTDGPLAGKRVVRGREADCRRYYEQQGDED